MNIMFEKAERKTVSLLCECGGQSQRGCQQGETQQLRLMQKKKNGKEKESVGYSVDSIRFCKTGREGEKREREGSLLGENPKLS